ncbi:MAG: SMP-30/gluconolactonase/LRE family protein [Endozoicomonas sp.]
MSILPRLCLTTGLSLALLISPQVTLADALKPLWVADGFKMPESVAYDAEKQKYYVSNINGGPLIEDGNGSISLLNMKGEMETADFVTGLHSPKGLALFDNKIYIADVKALVVADLQTGRVVQQHTHKNIKLLNGIAVDASGQVFVSDWLGNSIYRLKDGTFELWLHSEKLNSPNGLWLTGTTLSVASWGRDVQSDFSTKTSGALLQISRATKEVQIQEIDREWVNMDGISVDNQGRWLISDFLKGEILLLDKGGSATTLMEGLTTPADFIYIPETQQIVIPSFTKNQVTAYQLQERREK